MSSAPGPRSADRPGGDPPVAGERLRNSRLAWAVAVVAAAGGIAWWLLSATDLAWVIGLALVMPLALLILFESGIDTSAGGGDGGAWGPP